MHFVYKRNVQLKSSPAALFFERLSWTEGIHANLSWEKPFLFGVNEQICICFRKFSKGTNVWWNICLNFASQCKLCELLSFGAYNYRFISVICFLKRTHLPVHRFNSLIFFSRVEYSPHSSFSCCWKNIEYIYLNKFQSKKSLLGVDNEKTQNWNIARSFCAKVLLRIISIKLFVLWQVWKPPIRKAIFKRILRQRF